MSRPLKVFLSYAREDEARVSRLYDDLAAAGFQPWQDKRDIPEGEPWHEEIRNAVRGTDVFLACISKDSVRKEAS
jgi:hypothetical protein